MTTIHITIQELLQMLQHDQNIMSKSAIIIGERKKNNISSAQCIVSIDDNDSHLRCGQMGTFFKVTDLNDIITSEMKSKYEIKDNDMAGLTSMEIFTTNWNERTFTYNEDVVDKICYSGTYLTEEKCDITTNNKIIHINRQLGRVIWQNAKTNEVLVLVDKDYVLDTTIYKEDQKPYSNTLGSEIFILNTNGKRQYIQNKPMSCCPWIINECDKKLNNLSLHNGK